MAVFAETPQFASPGYPVEGHSSINWGGVVKGALIVTGIAVAAVVGYSLLAAAVPAALSFFGPGTAAGSLAGGVAEVATPAFGWLGSGLNVAWGAISGIPAGLVNLLGLGSTNLAIASSGTEAVKAAATLTRTVGLAGAATAGAVATHALAPSLHDVHLTQAAPPDVSASGSAPDNSYTSGIFAAGTGAHAANAASIHEVAHAAHSAHEFNEDQKEQVSSWTDHLNRRQHASFADSARSHEEKRPASPRAESFAEQLNTDRANLDLALER